MLPMNSSIAMPDNFPISTLVSSFGPSLEFAKDMGSLTSYGTGGRAKYFISADSAEEVARALRAARKLSIPYFVLGGGTNLLVADSGYDGLVIKVDAKGLSLVGDDTIKCGAGEQLQALVDFATYKSLTGVEFAAGIWGTVGGAIYGNAGAFGGEIGKIVSSLTIVSIDGVVKTVGPHYCRFGYRDSHLKTTHEAVIDASFTLEKGDAQQIGSKVKEIMASRNGKHPNDGKSAGCFFKNIPDPKEKFGKLAAGKLLEEVGAKEIVVGGARVFDRHANIIVNTGTATSADIRKLADILKKKVHERFGITLEEEVIQLGRF